MNEQADANQKEFRRFITDIERHRDAYSGMNPFWRELTDTFHKALRTETTKDPGRVVQVANSIPKTNYLVRPQKTEAIDHAWQIIDKDLANLELTPASLKDLAVTQKSAYETTLAAVFLQSQNLLAGARQITTDALITPQYVTLRHFFYLSQLTPFIEKLQTSKASLDVLEIGAGGGALKLFLKQRFADKIRSYTIVDLPEMLCVSCASTLAFYPDEKIQIIHSDEDEISPSTRSIFVPADNVDVIRNGRNKYDLILNTHSFQEMDDGVIREYFDLIYSSASKQALFFNTNWVQSAMTRLDGTHFNNDPANYPYRDGDIVEFFQPDTFHSYLTKKFGYKGKTPTWTSIRWIGGSP